MVEPEAGCDEDGEQKLCEQRPIPSLHPHLVVDDGPRAHRGTVGEGGGRGCEARAVKVRKVQIQ